MYSDAPFVDSDEESEKFKQDIFDAQKLVQETCPTDKVKILERLNKNSAPRPVGNQPDDDPMQKCPQEIQILNAAETGKGDVIEQLLQERPELVNSHDSDGYTPLHRACYSDQPDIVKLLLQRGADVNVRTCDGWTPLHSACKWNNFNCAAVLLDFESDVNPLTNGGQTPLHLASTHPEAKETLYLLLSNPKIATNIRNKAGELAYDLAHRHCKYYKLFEMNDPCFNTI